MIKLKLKEFIRGMQEGEDRLHLALRVANNEGVIGDEEEVELHKFVRKAIEISTKAKVEELRKQMFPSTEDLIKEVEADIAEEDEKALEAARKEIEERRAASDYHEYKYDVDKGTLFDE